MNRTPGNRGSRAGVLKAGDLKAGVLEPAPLKLRAMAALFLLDQVRDVASDRNHLLYKVQLRQATPVEAYTIKTRQLSLDSLLWLVTVSSLSEIDEHARRIAECPEDVRETLLEILGTPAGR